MKGLAEAACCTDPHLRSTRLCFHADRFGACWVLVKGGIFSYHHKETISFTIDPYYVGL